jgi:D-alanyl-D-alanine carboxypeptidase
LWLLLDVEERGTVGERPGLLVERLDPTGAVTIAGWRPQTALAPASTMKIITSAAALMTVGPDFRFTTRLEAAPDSVGPGGIVSGPVYLIGAGDPMLATRAYSRSGLDGLGTPLEDLARNVREASIDEKGERTATGYDPLEWELDQNGKKVRRGRVELSQEVVTVQDEGEDVEVVQLRSPEDPKWDPTVKEPVGASFKRPMSPEEILQAQQSDEAVEKRRLREAKTKVVEEDYVPMGLFD